VSEDVAMTDDELMLALEHDESYEVIKVLADRPGCRTELVRARVADAGPAADESNASGVVDSVRVEGESTTPEVLDSFPGLLVRKRMAREIASPRVWRTLATIDEPRIPQVMDVYDLPDLVVVVLRYVAGWTLEECVEKHGPLSLGDAERVIGDVCAAADALHARGIVHRDITPRNVVLARDGTSHLIDLGIARIHDELAEKDTTVLGTWGFAAPEQFGFAQTDARSDVYAIGGLLGYLLTGASPKDERYAELLADETRVPVAVRAVAERARAFEPGRRYATAGALAHELRVAVRGGGAAVEGGATASSAVAGGGTVAGGDSGAPGDAVPSRETAFREAVPHEPTSQAAGHGSLGNAENDDNGDSGDDASEPLRPQGLRDLYVLRVWGRIPGYAGAWHALPWGVRKVVSVGFVLLGLPGTLLMAYGVAWQLQRGLDASGFASALVCLNLGVFCCVLPVVECCCTVTGIGVYAQLGEGRRFGVALSRIVEEVLFCAALCVVEVLALGVVVAVTKA